jgi:hypothetical protein
MFYCYFNCRQRRVVRSTFTGELYAFSYLIDRLIVCLEMLKAAKIKVKRIIAMTDCSSVLQCTRSTNPRCTEKRHLVEISIIQELLSRYNIECHHIAGEYNPVDVFTKLKPSEEARKLLRSQTINPHKTTLSGGLYVSRE